LLLSLPLEAASNPVTATGNKATVTRTRPQIEALITQAGSTPPTWWQATPLNYPNTLNLHWAEPTKPWNPQKNLGQYVWDIINPNPAKWREGVRLMHYVLTVNKDDSAKLTRTAENLADMYQFLLQDYARAAFWLRKSAQLGKYDIEEWAVQLGECYWKLGSRDMCVELISKVEDDETGPGTLIKLWSDLGELDKALKMAESKAKYERPEAAYLAAADACRLHGRIDQAMAYYQKVLAIPQDKHTQRWLQRARESYDSIKLFDRLDLKRVPDGSYRAGSQGYAGPLQIEVQVKSARIQDVKVTQHKEKQFYSSISDTTARIIERQHVKGVDMTTGATITAEAIVNATAKALSGAMR
jgi:uncharacterized protein with FMN-binding domain